MMDTILMQIDADAALDSRDAAPFDAPCMPAFEVVGAAVLAGKRDGRAVRVLWGNYRLGRIPIGSPGA